PSSLMCFIPLASEIDLTDSVTLNGSGVGKLTVSGSDSSRIFSVAGGVTATISCLTLSRGMAANGGAILNAGNLTLSKDVFSNDTAQGAANGGHAFRGAGLHAGGMLKIDASTFTDNQAIGGDGGVTGTAGTLSDGTTVSLLGMAGGGAVWNDGGTVQVTGSSFSGNLARGGSGGDISGSTATVAVG